MDLQEFQSIVSDYFDENINFTGEYLLKGDQTHVDQKSCNRTGSGYKKTGSKNVLIR